MQMCDLHWLNKVSVAISAIMTAGVGLFLSRQMLLFKFIEAASSDLLFSRILWP